MQRVWSLYRTSVGKKIAMALTGLALYGFVVVHMFGNLKIYQGAEKFDAYASALREFGAPLLGHEQFLWIARIVLLACVAVHFLSAMQLWKLSRTARPTGYRRKDDLSFSFASRTMRWGGLILVGFIVYHLLHLTLGSVHPGFSHESPFANVISGFRVLPVAIAYVLCMLPLGFHMYHGLWSMTQTLAIDVPLVQKLRRPVSAGVALTVVIGNISIPVSVLLGLVE